MRTRVEGGMYFFTVVTYKRLHIFSDPLARTILHTAISKVQQRHPFQLIAICLLPDHIHSLWKMPENDADYSLRWKEIKRIFTYTYAPHMRRVSSKSESRKRRKENTVWQRRFWEHLIRDDKDLENHLDYIHFNPVKHGYSTKPIDWEWSSFRRFVAEGKYDVSWGDQGEPHPAGLYSNGE